MKNILEKADVRALILQSLINGGLEELYNCDCVMDLGDDKANGMNYDKARAMIEKDMESGDYEGVMGSEMICTEDVYIRMFEEFGLHFDDYTMGNIVLTPSKAKRNLQKAIDDDSWFLSEVLKVIPEYDDADAYTYFNILQGALFGEVIYG